MKGFIKSFVPILKRLKEYLLEFIILSAALILTIIAIIIYAGNYYDNRDEVPSAIPAKLAISSPKISVDLSGAVKKPGLYEINFGARLKDVLDKSGGLSDEADTTFFKRNFNLARVVADQEKIYIPSIPEINNGVFIEDQRTLNYLSAGTGVMNSSPTITSPQGKISLNSATIDELDQLTGIGQVTANKIINNRPFSAIEDLLTKKIVSKSVFEKIKSQVDL